MKVINILKKPNNISQMGTSIFFFSKIGIIINPIDIVTKQKNNNNIISTQSVIPILKSAFFIIIKT